MSISAWLIACHRGFQLSLDHAVELKRLSRRQSQRSVGVAARNFIERQPLLRGADPAGQAGADHETVGRLELLQPPLLAQVAIVLLIAPVELEELRIVLVQRPGNRIGEAVHDRSAQAPAGRLDALDGRELGHQYTSRT